MQAKVAAGWSETDSQRLRRSIDESMVETRLLLLNSKRLLLGCAERSARNARSAAGSELVDALRSELTSAEVAYTAAGARWRGPIHSARLRRYFAGLIESTASSAAELTERAHRARPEHQFEIATYVQILDELIEQWSQVFPDQAKR